jgi:hypothetical protein
MTEFHSARRIALVLSARLGDSLLMMSLANNLARAGRDVTVFSAQISRLARWCPQLDIRPVPTAERAAAELADFDVVVQMHADRPLPRGAIQQGRFACFDEWRARAAARLREHGRPALVGELGLYAHDVFGVAAWDDRNGLTPPPGLRHRTHRHRVVIHPTAGSPEGCWPRAKYEKLAQALARRGLQPEFVVEQHERAAWLDGADPHAFRFVDAPSLDALAAYLYESGWFIGSDSGVGHLASTCGIPTVTITERLRNMRRWKPAWAEAEVVRPLWLPGNALRRRFWRAATTVRRVLRAFDTLRARVDG